MTPFETSFTHADGRVFTYIGDVPHTTRDGRNITLREWDTCCGHPGCQTHFTVKTATSTPWLWANFRPASFCGVHRTAARRAGRQKQIKARADGLTRWRQSAEGKAVLEQRAKDCMGVVERTLYEVVCDLSLADGAARWSEAYKLVLARMEAPKEGKRDTRRQRVMRAFWALQEKGRISYRNEVITLLR